MADYIAAYGTLKAEFGRQEYLGLHKCTPMGVATMPLDMYNLGWYPGAVFNSDSSLEVELLKLPQDEGAKAIIMDALDRYEGYPTLFTRARHPAKLADGTEVTAWVYLFNLDIPAHAPQITLFSNADRDF